MKRIDLHHDESDGDREHRSTSDTKNWLNWNCDIDNPNESEDNSDADVESDIQLDNGIKNLETP